MRGQPGMPPREEQYAQLPGPSLHFHAIEQAEEQWKKGQK